MRYRGSAYRLRIDPTCYLLTLTAFTTARRTLGPRTGYNVDHVPQGGLGAHPEEHVRHGREERGRQTRACSRRVLGPVWIRRVETMTVCE